MPERRRRRTHTNRARLSKRLITAQCSRNVTIRRRPRQPSAVPTSLAIAAAASHLGMLLEERGDLAGAEAAYRRADERGDAAGTFRLGALLAHRGDTAEAEIAYRRADERGHAGAPSSLGSAARAAGDLAEAEAAYRRADERGDALGAFNLAAIFAERKETCGGRGRIPPRRRARPSIGRHEPRRDPRGARRPGRRGSGVPPRRSAGRRRRRLQPRRASGGQQRSRGRRSGLRTRGRSRRHRRGDKPRAASRTRGDLAGAEAAYQRADEGGDAAGAFNLGRLLADWGDLEGAEAAFRRADERGDDAVRRSTWAGCWPSAQDLESAENGLPQG